MFFYYKLPYIYYIDTQWNFICEFLPLALTKW